MFIRYRPRERGFNVVGFVTANLGLGVAARHTISRLLADGEHVGVIDIDPGARFAGKDTTYAHLQVPTRASAYSVNMFHLNPPEAAGYWRKWRPRLSITGSVNVCVPFWELPALPPSWIPILECMDYVLAPTHFVEDACLAVLPRDRVVYYPQVIDLPDQVAANRARWAIPADALSFLVTLDINSDVQRKNPWAAIEAFSLAFPSDEDVRLVVRVNGEPRTDVTLEQVASLTRRAEDDPRIIIVREPLSYPDVLSLYRSCDVLVSLHRSEGLGLHLMEAMWLGVPVVATAWSGNMDFMDAESVCLVEAEFVPVEATQESYAAELIGPGQYWAEPKVAMAAEHLRRLARDPEYRRGMAKRGHARIEAYILAARGNNALQTIAGLDVREVRATPDSRRRLQQFRRLLRKHAGRRGPTEAAKHAVVVALRAVRLYPAAPEHERQ